MEKTENVPTVAMRTNNKSYFGFESLRGGVADYAKGLTTSSQTKKKTPETPSQRANNNEHRSDISLDAFYDC
jgi:hypothetical protein